MLTFKPLWFILGDIKFKDWLLVGMMHLRIRCRSTNDSIRKSGFVTFRLPICILRVNFDSIMRTTLIFFDQPSASFLSLFEARTFLRFF